MRTATNDTVISAADLQPHTHYTAQQVFLPDTQPDIPRTDAEADTGRRLYAAHYIVSVLQQPDEAGTVRTGRGDVETNVFPVTFAVGEPSYVTLAQGWPSIASYVEFSPAPPDAGRLPILGTV